MTNSRDQYYGNASHCVFYNGLTTLKIEGNEFCDYESERYRGETFTPSMNPFISTEVPKVPLDENGKLIPTYTFLRDANFNLTLGDFLRVNPESEFYTMGENGLALGANL